MTGNGDDILTPADIRAWLKLESESAVYELVRPVSERRKLGRPPLPGFHVGKYLRFRRSEVAIWLESRRIGGPRTKGPGQRAT
jgi:hypothetical protein